MENITQFFYNIVPATTFLLVFTSIFPDTPLKINGSSPIQVFIFIVLSILLGFLTQSVFKLIRECFFDQFIWEKIKTDNNKIYTEVKNLLKNNNLTDNKSNVSIDKQVFHTIDNYLEARKLSGYTSHFMPRAAFWSNLLILSVFLMFCLALKVTCLKTGLSGSEQILGILILPTTLVISIFMTYYSLRAVYEVVLITFISIYKFKSIEA